MTSPVKNHNKGPIGPLDSEPPEPWSRHDLLPVSVVTGILREMGADIRDRDIEESIAEGTGPPHTVGAAHEFYGGGGVVRSITLADAIAWSQRTFRRDDVLTRKQATEFIRGLGYPISDSTLQQNMYGAGPKLRFTRPNSRTAYYTEEDCRAWVEECRALGLSPGSFAPKKYKPRTTRHCPAWHKDCPNVPHKDCAKYARAQCNFVHLQDRPSDPKALRNRAAQASGMIAAIWAGADIFFSLTYSGPRLHLLFQWPARRPDKDASGAYLAAWSSG